MNTKIVITEAKELNISSVPNHTQLPESDGKFVKIFRNITKAFYQLTLLNQS